jgi:hypothetical protein
MFSVRTVGWNSVDDEKCRPLAELEIAISEGGADEVERVGRRARWRKQRAMINLGATATNHASFIFFLERRSLY